MTRARKAKKEIKILKEIDSRNFKEVKKDENGNIEEEAENESEKNVGNEKFESGNGFSSSGGSRTAPVLKSEDNSQLEREVASAPVRNTEKDNNKSGVGNGYSSNYTTKYENRDYETRGQEMAVRPTVRSAGAIGGLIEQRNADFSNLRRTQNLWKDSGQQNSGAWEPDRINLVNNERKYAEDKRVEETKQIDKRRRMM